MENTTTQKRSWFSSLANPVIRKLEKNATYEDSNCATYGGIAAKTFFFLLTTCLGVALCFLLHQMFLKGNMGEIMHFADTKNGIYDLTFSSIEAIIMIGVLLISLIVPFLAWFLRKTIPVTGTIYCLAQGMLIGYITVALAPGYKFISFLAMIITLALVGAMLFVYIKKIIKVTARFKGAIIAIFFGVVGAGIIYFVLNLIPAVRNSYVMTGINSVMNNPVVSIIFSVVFVILAALFMLADFDTIQRCVENHVDKKYEWMAAWGLAYTVLYIYFKILRILLTIFGSRSSSK